MAINEILIHLSAASTLAKDEYGIENILQPGVLKEMVLADILGHRINPVKHQCDAFDQEGNQVEYLTSLVRTSGTNQGCSFQFSSIHEGNMYRVERNTHVYFGVFLNLLEVSEIWKASSSDVAIEVRRQLCAKPRVRDTKVNHASLKLEWVRLKGERVWSSQETLQAIF